MIIKSLKISSVSAVNFLIKNFLVFIVFDLLVFTNNYGYSLILLYIFFQSYFLHAKFTLKRKVDRNSFILFFKLNLILFLFDYLFFLLINIYFPFFVVSTVLISFVIHLIRILLFSREMD